MSDTKKAGQETLKNMNRQIILNYLRENSETSRVDLAKQTKLSPTTVSAITSELVNRNLVKEIRIGESNGGRKPLMLDINPNARFVITIILTQKGAEFSILDLNYHKVEQKYISHVIEGSEVFMEVILSGLKEILGGFRYNADDICGLGISLPGVIDHKNGKILYSSKLHITDFDISTFIKENTGMKAYVFKDSDAGILGEFNAGVGGNYDSLAYISVEDGVGMSYINSGKLFHPSVGGGFELGHITIDSNGPVCRCGNRGCLGAMVSEQPILNKLKVLCEKGHETIIKEDFMSLSLADVVEYSNKGDKASRYVLGEQARILGTAIATVVNLFSPQLVLIGGPLSGCKWSFFEMLKDTVQDRALSIYSRNMDIKPAKLNNKSAQTGIASEIFAREIFKDVKL
ncbi:MAG: ROK family transcriptional regulator [Ruminiclostridium sp.]